MSTAKTSTLSTLIQLLPAPEERHNNQAQANVLTIARTMVAKEPVSQAGMVDQSAASPSSRNAAKPMA